MILIKNVQIINEARTKAGSLLIKNHLIEKIYTEPEPAIPEGTEKVIDGQGFWLMPGVIDMHVHFREPGLTHKADTESETKAALAGGITSFAEMPNTNPKTIGQAEWEAKSRIAEKNSYINYSYYIGADENNADFIAAADSRRIPGVKVFMGASTGNMQIAGKALDKVYNQNNLRITAHCEDDEIIRQNLEKYRTEYGETIPFKFHSKIRSTEACLKSSKEAVSLAKKHDSKLHIAHISTAEELELITNSQALEEKKITTEVCIHHLWFNDKDYDKKGAFIKWNPAIKSEKDRQALLQAVNEDVIDIIVTDHAPHTLEEKQKPYTQAPSGAPMIQHSLQAALELSKQGYFTKEKVVEKMCHHPARLFGIKKRGFLREGYFADLTIINPDAQYTVNKNNILYKCGWSPMEGEIFTSKPEYVFVNGKLLYENGNFSNKGQAMPLEFNKKT
jgi:dihydroorotase